MHFRMINLSFDYHGDEYRSYIAPSLQLITILVCILRESSVIALDVVAQSFFAVIRVCTGILVLTFPLHTDTRGGHETGHS